MNTSKSQQEIVYKYGEITLNLRAVFLNKKHCFIIQHFKKNIIIKMKIKIYKITFYKVKLLYIFLSYDKLIIKKILGKINVLKLKSFYRSFFSVKNLGDRFCILIDIF